MLLDDATHRLTKQSIQLTKSIVKLIIRETKMREPMKPLERMLAEQPREELDL